MQLSTACTLPGRGKGRETWVVVEVVVAVVFVLLFYFNSKN